MDESTGVSGFTTSKTTLDKKTPDKSTAPVQLVTAQEKHRVLPWLALNRMQAFGAVSQRQLLDTAGGMARLCEVPADVLRCYLPAGQAREWLDFCCGKPDSVLLAAAERDYAIACDSGMHILPVESDAYPLLLAQIHGAPTVLFVQGNTACLHLPQLAVVGSRNASAGGLELAQEFAASLGQQGLAITSGLALGIDGAAHRGALSAGADTVAVVATGLDEIYPRRHVGLAQAILAAGGAIVSEFAPRTKPHAQNFPRRNRIISGLSLGTLVIEATLQSGSLITARYAMEQGREVFALPGSVRSVFHRGCHALIRQGATLVETTADIAEQLGGMLAFKQSECAALKTLHANTDDWSGDAVKVFRLLDHTPTGMDILAERCQLPVAVLSAALLDLEMAGVVTQLHGFYSRC